jgi:RNA polymerase sigma-70 factor, ECF subfamily
VESLICAGADGLGERVAGDETERDLRSFVEFYETEYRGVLAFAASLCRDLHAGEDLAQDAFIAAERRWDKLERYDRPDLWVRRAVANRSVSRWRRLVSEERRAGRLSTLPSAEPSADGREDDLWRLVRQLPARQAQVIALTYLEDRSLDDVAEVLGIGVETAKTHLQRGKAALARAINAEEDTEDDS